MMNNELRPYDEYINTDIFWLDRIPQNWGWQFLSQACKEKCYKNTFNTEKNVLSLSYGQIIRKKNIDFGLVPKEYTGYQIVKKGDIILRLTDLQNDKRSLRTGLVKETGIITSAYTCINTKINSPDYIHYILHAYDLQKVFYGMGGGVRQSIGYEDIRKLKLPVPPRSEQDQIVKYLDHQLAKINKFIKTKKKLIAVLKEQKQAIINEVVTKGLDPNVKMKPSGIEWLGDVPESWSSVRLRFLCNFRTGDKDTVNRVDNGVYPFYVRSPHVERINTYTFDGEAILTAGDGVGAGKVFHYAKGKFDYHQRVYNLHNIKGIVPEYLYYYLKTNFYKEIEKGNAKSTVDSIRLPMLKNFQIIFGDEKEQLSILEYIKSNEYRIDTSIASIQKEIVLIQEYKNSLISDVVTGKVDVRNIVFEESEEEIIEDIELDEDSIDEETLEVEDGDE